MSKNVAVFVDVANLYYAARGQDVDVDYVALLKHATKGRDLIRAYAYSGLDPENDNQKKFLDFLGKNGYKVVAKDIRKFGDGRVKANLDIELVVDLFRLADRMDIAVIVSGDGDFAPAIRALQDSGVRCEVISFKPNTSSELFAVADEFIDVMKISAIGRQKDSKGVGAPEMPAKEVNPDVGFREASPSVAAAALAAIRSNGDEMTSRGRDRGRRSRAKAPAREPVAAAEPARPAAARPAETVETTEGARRRRRRGGRGRGRRGRRGDVAAEAAFDSGTEPATIGWQELDTLDELNALGAEEGVPALEFGFEEADAATLAELGLESQPESSQTAAEEPTAAPTGRRTRRAAAAPKGQPESEPAKAGTARTSRSRSTAKTAATKTAASRKPAATATKTSRSSKTKSAATAADTEPKKARPTRATRSKSAAGADAAPATAEGDSPDEGIWKRLTSGRGTRRRANASSPSES